MENYIFKKIIILSMCNLSKKLMVVVFRGVSNNLEFVLFDLFLFYI